MERHPIAVDVKTCRKQPVKEQKDISEEMDVKQGKLVLALHTDMNCSLEERTASRVAVALLGGTATSLLHTNVREKLSLCYYCAARLDTATGILMIDSGVEAENCDKTRDACLAQIEAMQKGEFEESLLLETQLFFKTAYRATGDSLGAMENWYLTNILLGNEESLEESLAACQKVTKEQIVAAVNKLKLDTVYRLVPNSAEKEAE